MDVPDNLKYLDFLEYFRSQGLLLEDMSFDLPVTLPTEMSSTFGPRSIKVSTQPRKKM